MCNLNFRPFSRTTCVITAFQLYRRFFFLIETSGIDLGHVIVNEPNCLKIAQAQLKNKSLFIFFYLINRENYNLPTCNFIEIKIVYLWFEI